MAHILCVCSWRYGCSGDTSSMTAQESADRLIHCLFLLPLRLANTASGRSSLPGDYHDRLSEAALEVSIERRLD